MSFTCNACQYVITSTEQRAEHYRSFWHRYNVKRGCEGLSSVPQDVFESKLAQITRAKNEKKSLSCGVCRKTFASKKNYEHHVRSKRHLQKVANRSESSGSSTPVLAATLEQKQGGDAKLNTSVITEGATGDGKQNGDDTKKKDPVKSTPVPLSHCLFCGSRAANVEESLRHMLKAHSFYLPYMQYLINLDSLMLYLGEKVGVGHQCLYCNHRFGDIEAVRQHMRDCSHCKLSFEDEEDREEYQDFFSSPNEKKDKSNAVEDGEQKSTESGEDQPKALILTEPEGVASEMTDLGEIVMKDGRIIGHRSLSRYYKQSLKPVDPEHGALVNKIMRDYRAIGLPGYQAKSKRNEKSRKDVLEANKRFMKLGFKGNKQKHFKDSTAPFN